MGEWMNKENWDPSSSIYGQSKSADIQNMGKEKEN